MATLYPTLTRMTLTLTVTNALRLRAECKRLHAAEGAYVGPARIVNDALVKVLPPLPEEEDPEAMRRLIEEHQAKTEAAAKSAAGKRGRPPASARKPVTIPRTA
jgi:hypothetical protein